MKTLTEIKKEFKEKFFRVGTNIPLNSNDDEVGKQVGVYQLKFLDDVWNSAIQRAIEELPEGTNEHEWEISNLGATTCRNCGEMKTNPVFPRECKEPTIKLSEAKNRLNNLLTK